MIQHLLGDCRLVLKELPTNSVACCVTSPPYFGLRDYGAEKQIGLEPTPDDYVENMVQVFREVKRVLKDEGTLWLNLGDSFGHRKQLLGIPWMVAFALQKDGWILRSDIIWHKPNPMPESVKDRPTKSHEYIFLFAKTENYHYDADAVLEPLSEATIERSKYRWKRTQNGGGSKESMKGYDYANQDFGDMTVNLKGRNKRSVWTVPTKSFKGAHFAVFPPNLIRPCIVAGCPVGGTVLDPFGGSGTTGIVAEQEGRNAVLIELNPEYIELQKQRTAQVSLFAA